MVLNQASRQIVELQHTKNASPLLEIQLHRFIQNMASHLFCGLNPSSHAKFEAVIKKFCSQPVLLTATIETEELRGKITQDQYSLVLEDLFIGLTKSCPQGINYLTHVFRDPLENLKCNYFSTFGHGSPSSLQPLMMSSYLDSQQTPDKTIQTPLDPDKVSQRTSQQNTIARSIPVRQDIRRSNSKAGAIENISCSFLKMVCLNSELRTKPVKSSQLTRSFESKQPQT